MSAASYMPPLMYQLWRAEIRSVGGISSVVYTSVHEKKMYHNICAVCSPTPLAQLELHLNLGSALSGFHVTIGALSADCAPHSENGCPTQQFAKIAVIHNNATLGLQKLRLIPTLPKPENPNALHLKWLNWQCIIR